MKMRHAMLLGAFVVLVLMGLVWMICQDWQPHREEHTEFWYSSNSVSNDQHWATNKWENTMTRVINQDKPIQVGQHGESVTTNLDRAVANVRAEFRKYLETYGVEGSRFMGPEGEQIVHVQIRPDGTTNRTIEYTESDSDWNIRIRDEDRRRMEATEDRLWKWKSQTNQ